MRLPDWRGRLEHEIRAARARTFEYGQWDCVHFTARCIDAMTGSRWLDELPAYRSQFGMWRQLWREGGLERAITARLGPVRPIGESTDGDPCLVRWYASRVVGIRFGAGILAPDLYGLADVLLTLGTRCWRV